MGDTLVGDTRVAKSMLRALVGSMFLLLIGAFVFIFFSGLFTRSAETAPSRDQFSDLKEGETALRRIANQRAWVTRLSAEQRQSLHDRSPCVTRQFCAVVAATLSDGIELVYSSEPPPLHNPNQPWLGGLVDPRSGRLFDLAGRQLLVEHNATQLPLLTTD